MSLIVRTREVIMVLCNRALTAEQILKAVQHCFPTTLWTMAQVDLVLTTGKRKGRFLLCNTLWTVNPRMVLLNKGENQRYMNLCDQILGLPCCGTTIITTSNAPFVGHEPCFQGSC